MIDLFSDTKTRPTAQMRAAMMEAEVGDEQMGEDPSVNALCERVADMLGKESAVFLPSGCMANELAIKVLCRPGDDVVCERSSHIVHYEAGAPAALSGVTLMTIDGDRGRYSVEQARAVMRKASFASPGTRMICCEQTTNIGGGALWELDDLRALTELAHAHAAFAHLDGARLMNAVVAQDVAPSEFAYGFDSAWIDFSKVLGAPVGSVLAGSRDFIDEAWFYKKQWGGAMRQAGILAAACSFALDHHVDRLADDHANARRLAEGLAELPGLLIDPSLVDTNLVFFELAEGDANAFAAALQSHGVRVSVVGPRRLRAVTHLDISVDDIDAAVAAFEQVIFSTSDSE